MAQVLCPASWEVRSRGSWAGQGRQGQGAFPRASRAPPLIGLNALQRPVWKLLPWVLQPSKTQGSGHVGRSSPCWEVLGLYPCLQALQPGSPLPQGEPLPGKPLEDFRRLGAGCTDWGPRDIQARAQGRGEPTEVLFSIPVTPPLLTITQRDPHRFSFLSTIPLDSSQQQGEVSHGQA